MARSTSWASTCASTPGRLPAGRFHARLSAGLRRPPGLGVPRPVRGQLRHAARRRPLEVGRHLEMVGLAEKRDALVVELSRGMRQRLMLAKTLIPEPRALLLDEPASGVDPQGRIDLKNILRRLGDEGKTVLISSHILAEMNEFCTSVAIMERGSVVVSGRIDEVNRRIMGDTLLAVEVLGEPERVPRRRRRRRAGRRDRAQERRLTSFASMATPTRPASCWRPWYARGFRVASFVRRKDNLEDLFLKVGSKELS